MKRTAAGDQSNSDHSDDDVTVVKNGEGADGEEGGGDAEGRISSEWWASHVKLDDKFDHALSGKLVLLAEILRLSEAIGDKV